MFISKNNRHGNLRVLYPTPNPNPTQVPRYPRWPLVDSKHGNKKTEGWNLLEEIRKGVSDEALVSQVAEAVQRCRHGRRCEGHYSYIYIHMSYIYRESLVMLCSYVIVVSLVSLIYVYLCHVCHLCQSLIVWFLETSRSICWCLCLTPEKNMYNCMSFMSAIDRMVSRNLTKHHADVYAWRKKNMYNW